MQRIEGVNICNNVLEIRILYCIVLEVYLDLTEYTFRTATAVCDYGTDKLLSGETAYSYEVENGLELCKIATCTASDYLHAWNLHVSACLQLILAYITM